MSRIESSMLSNKFRHCEAAKPPRQSSIFLDCFATLRSQPAARLRNDEMREVYSQKLTLQCSKSRKIKFYILLFFLMGLLTTSGCSVLSPVSAPSMQTYLLNNAVNPVQISSPVKSAKATKVLLVSAITSPAWLNTAQMAYQLENAQLGYFARNQWAAPPADLLQPIVVHAIERAGLYRAVVAVPFTGNYDQRLDVELLEMQQIFIQQSSHYVMTVRVQLVDRYAEKIIASERFHLVIPARQADPQGGVLAANQAVNQWLPQLLDFIRQHQ